MPDAEQNFARYTRSYWYDHPEEQASIVQEHVARIEQGVDVWNTFDQAFADYLKKNNIVDGLYAFEGAELSNVNFSGAQFSGKTDFQYAIFSGYAHFMKATFSGEANFIDATFNGESSFAIATFSGDAHFMNATFGGESSFAIATFSGDAHFMNATFGGYADFMNATFGGYAYFSEATFGGYAHFMNATFGDAADFDKATFSGDAFFSDVSFGDAADFYEATFSGDAYFWEAKFNGVISFRGATFASTCSFNQSTSKKSVPNFISAQYKTAPLIEGFVIPWVKDQSEQNIEMYRQLKKFAIEGSNHEQEVRFFGFETRCKMYMEYPALTRFSVWLYWVFSNFGQSLLRPLGALILVWIVATAMTISTTMKTPIPTALSSLIMFEYLGPCEAIPSNAFRSKLDAIRSQSIGSSLTLPVIAMDKDTQHQRNQCLYGQGGGVPETNRIINGIQQVLSLIFLFLFGLAVRNRFKIK